jgi:hypothetical protein
MDLKHKLEKQKDLIQMTADNDSDANEEDSSVEDNEIEAEL